MMLILLLNEKLRQAPDVTSKDNLSSENWHTSSPPFLSSQALSNPDHYIEEFFVTEGI